jgi:hypothetical protein
LNLSVVGVICAPASLSRLPLAGELVGGRDFFFCAALQAVKVVGLFTANPTMVLAGAIGGGVACGFGW